MFLWNSWRLQATGRLFMMPCAKTFVNRDVAQVSRSWRFLVTLLYVLLATFPLTVHAVFNTPGQFSVDDGGSANYAVPIRVPPGTAGMAPNISLNYDSQRSNGILGLGWGLSGISQIDRCPRTMAQDGARGGINFDAIDPARIIHDAA